MDAACNVEAISSNPSPSPMVAPAPQAFRFLDLPTEVRLIVYERLPLITTTQVCKIDLTIEDYCRCDCDYLFPTTIKLQYALLAISKLIGDEALSYLDSALAKTQPGLFHCSGLNDGSGHVHPSYFVDVLMNLIVSAQTQDYIPHDFPEGGVFTKDDLARVLNFCAFAKQHQKATGRVPKAAVH